MEEKCSEVEPIRQWTFYPAGFHYGKRCVIDGYIRSNAQTSKEVTLEKLTGSSKKIYNQRGGVPSISKGDKSYLVPEYSSNFHKIGSTRPAINFSRSSNVVCDTFIPLQPLQRKLRHTYAEKNRQCLEEEEKLSVAMLSRWKPTKSLTASL